MTFRVTVESIHFDFPDGWEASKYDDWDYYRLGFSRAISGMKAVDLVAVDDHSNLYLVEVKDYSRPGTPAPSQLAETVARKVLHSLAGLAAARLRAPDAAERSLADKAMASPTLSVSLHCEIGAHLRMAINASDIKMKLRQFLAAVDPSADVLAIGITTPGWTASR